MQSWFCFLGSRLITESHVHRPKVLGQRPYDSVHFTTIDEIQELGEATSQLLHNPDHKKPRSLTETSVG